MSDPWAVLPERTAADVIQTLRTRRMMEQADVDRRQYALSRCEPCREGEHTSPPGGSYLCRCPVPTCACIAVPLRFKVP